MTIPYSIYTSSCFNIGPIIYIAGVAGNNYYKFMTFNTETNEFSDLPNLPLKNSNGTILLINNSIYFFNGNENSLVKVFITNYKDYPDKSIVIWGNSGNYLTKLYEDEEIQGDLKYRFNDVWLYTNETKLDNSIPTYYGNGTQWIKFKN